MNKNTVLLLFVLLLSLAILSGCGSGSGSFVDRISAGSYYVEDGPEVKITREEILEDKILELEEEKAELSGTIEDYEDAFFKMNKLTTVLYCYFEEGSVSFDEAYDAYEELNSIINKHL